MAKKRTPIPPDISAKVLFASDHTCCKCRERGKPIQIHHIDEDPSNNNEDNLATLCLICHDLTQISGGFGRKVKSGLVIQYRNDWLKRVVERRDKADQIAVSKMAGDQIREADDDEEEQAVMVPADISLVSYVAGLPSILKKAYDISRPRWDTGVTSETIEGTNDVIEVVIQMLTHLSSWFPYNHFNGLPAKEYFSNYVAERFIWHRALAEPNGVGTGGTIVGPVTILAVLSNVEDAVVEMIGALLAFRKGFILNAWRQEWEYAKKDPTVK